jgi:multidrug resistance protein MdtO
MTQSAETVSRWRESFAWLQEELAPKPGRGFAVARISATCAIAVLIGMIFQIPMTEFMVYFVLPLSKEETVATVIAAVGGALAATLAAGLTVLIFTLDAAEPAIRLPVMAASTFLGVFLARTSRLGPIAFLAAYIVVLSQTLVDGAPSMEVVTRLVLWLWLVVMVPAVLTAIVNLMFGMNPAKLAREMALRLLKSVTATLAGEHSNELAREQAEAIKLIELRQHAQIADRELRGRANVDHRLIETLIELLTVLRALPVGTPREIRRMLAGASEECGRALASEHAPVPDRCILPVGLLGALSADVQPIVVAIENALRRIGDDIARRRTAVESPAARTVAALFVPDAWKNPEYVRFALKTTIALMAAYIAYSLIDWPGIRTAVPTCFFVAMASLGETVHKLLLRICGALIGGLAAGLCLVYLLPHMTTIGQLCLLIAAGAAISGWVATSSERLSYMGLQIALAFFLGVLQGYGPPASTDLTVLWDRIAGILLGNVLISIVFSTLWPVSALDRARAALAKAMRGLAELIRNAVHPQTDARLSAVQRLAEARRFTSIATFEASMLPGRKERENFEESALAQLDRLATAVFVVAGQSSGDDIGDAARVQDSRSSAWFAESAGRFLMGESVPAAPDRAAIADAQAVLPDTAALPLRTAIEARAFLQREIEHVASPG